MTRPSHRIVLAILPILLVSSWAHAVVTRVRVETPAGPAVGSATAGVASLLLSSNPCLTNEDLARILRQSSNDIDVPGVDQYTGYGLLNAEAGLAADPEFYVEASITGVAMVQKGGASYLQIRGSAQADKFRGASVSIGKGENPTDWQEVYDGIDKPVASGALVDLEVRCFRGAPQWTLRVVAEHQNGRQREARFVLNLKTFGPPARVSLHSFSLRRHPRHGRGFGKVHGIAMLPSLGSLHEGRRRSSIA